MAHGMLETVVKSQLVWGSMWEKNISRFNLPFLPDNTATIRSSGTSINPDSDTEFEVEVSITDNGSPPNTGSGTVLVQVYVNNNQHESATKVITVYSLEGKNVLIRVLYV